MKKVALEAMSQYLHQYLHKMFDQLDFIKFILTNTKSNMVMVDMSAAARYLKLYLSSINGSFRATTSSGSNCFYNPLRKTSSRMLY